jgi:hypothetical protein
MNYWEGKMSKGKVFTAQEVQAIIAGNKTMFREICKRQPQGEIEKPYVIRQAGITEFNYPFGKIPYQVGQKIFCKESFNIFAGQVAYKQSLTNAERYIWKPAQQMKQEHSRLTLLIKEIRVERLADISEEDAIAEGVDKLFTEEEMRHVAKVHPTAKNDAYKNYLWHGHIGKTITRKQSDEWNYQYSAYQKARDSFATLWNATHKKPEEKFEANPFVWSIQFEVVK